ncbi:MAG: AzlC family ABC transporter permease [Treponema sp.]|nr:AzlC family ABC transporter permease [Treponema sp.]
MKNKLLFQAFKASIPVLCGYITLGIAFGLVLINANYPWWLAPLMSVIMYAGAAQFVGIGLFVAAMPLSTILITQALVNIRHIVYGISLINKYKNAGKWKPYLIFALTDETYSLVTTVDLDEKTDPVKFYASVSLLNHIYWITGSTIGALLGNLIPLDFTGVDFALTALFAVLTVEQFLKIKDIIPILIGSLCTIASIILMKFGIIQSSNILLLALCAGLVAILLTKRGKNYA